MMNKIKSARVHLVKFMFVVPLLAILLVSFRQIVGDTALPVKPMITPADTVPVNNIKEEAVLPTTFTLHRDDNMSKEHRAFFERNSQVNLLHWKKNGDIEVYLKGGKVALYRTPADIEKFKSTFGSLPQAGGSVPVKPVIVTSPSSMVNPPSVESPVQAPNISNAESPVLSPGATSVEAPVPAPNTSVISPVSPVSPPVKVKPATPIKTTIKSALGDHSGKPLVLVDGEEWPAHLDLNMIDVEKIASISVFKNGTAINRYGDKGKSGVIEVTTRQGLITKPKSLDVWLEEAKLSTAPLFYLDGKEATIKTVGMLNPQKIKSVEVLKGNAAEQFGEKGKNGVIKISTLTTEPIQTRQADGL